MPLWLELKHVTHHLARRSALGLLLGGVGLFIGASPATAPAKEARTSFAVTVTVAAVAKIERASTPARLDISALDLQHGFVDVRDPVALQIRSNSAEGFVLDIVPTAPLVSSLVIDGLDSQARLGADGGTIVQRWQKAQTINLSLHLRLGLAAGVAAGSYPWPMHIDVRPLEALGTNTSRSP